MGTVFEGIQLSYGHLKVLNAILDCIDEVDPVSYFDENDLYEVEKIIKANLKPEDREYSGPVFFSTH